jgi:diguanylate cyclase (GGDEF)-like protein/PAS domain S-box-containing protein
MDSAKPTKRLTRTEQDNLASREKQLPVETQFRFLVDNISLPIIVADAAGCIEYLNEAAETLFGYGEAELVGQPFEMLLAERNRADGRREIAAARQAERGSGMRQGPVIAGRRDGTEFNAEVNVGPRWGDSDSGFSVVLRDITRWQEAEQNMTALLMQKEEAHYESEALRSASVLLSQNLKFDAVLGAILNSLSRLLAFDAASILTVEDNSRLVLQACRGGDAGVAPDSGASRPKVFDLREQGLLQRVVQTRESVLLTERDEKSSPGLWISEHTQSLAVIPLVVADRVVAICAIEKSELGSFTEDHVRRAELLVAQAAVAIQNARLFEQVEEYSSELEQKVREHARSKELLAETNQKLSSSLAELERRNYEVSRISEFADLLQACQIAEEVYQVFEVYCPRILAGREGALYIINSSKLAVEGVAGWALSGLSEPVFVPEACWALRRSRPHAADLSELKLRCPHLKGLDTSRTVCVPIMAHGEALGILALIQKASTQTDALTAENAEAEIRVATAMAEQIGLSLANLKLREKLRTQSVRDPLTGMFNRRYMEESVARELLRVTRKKAPMGIMMVDIDHFKKFNDTYGHEAGDTLICSVAKVLQSTVRGEDIVCRYGGEEFTVVMPEACLEITVKRANSLCQQVREISVQHRGQPLGRISISVGVAMLPDHGKAAEDLLRAADLALYEAKAAGRDRVVVSQSTNP